jgi:hypothetical protein
MEPESGSSFGSGLKGSAGITVSVVVTLRLIPFPADRWFFLMSLLIGLISAGAITLVQTASASP